MNLELQNRVTLIAGGTRGIGRACAEALLHEGAIAAVVGRDTSTLMELEGQYPKRLTVVSANLSIPGSAEAVVTKILDTTGRIDVLVNCAGSVPKLDLSATPSEWERAFTHKFATYLGTMRAVIPHMKQRREGAIINVVGSDGVRPLPWNLAAVANNAALLAVSRALAQELAPLGIKVNCINPGPTDTRRWDYVVTTVAERWNVGEAVARQRLMESMPTGRLVDPAEIAALVLLLASRKLDSLVGESITVDTMQRRDELAVDPSS